MELYKRFLSIVLVLCMIFAMVPAEVFAVSPGVVTTDIGEKEFTVGTSTEFTITTTANDDQGTMVIGTAVFSDPSAIEKLEYYEVQDGNWYELAGDFGPSTGFPMSDATSKFCVTFKKAGIYSVEIFIKSVEDDSVVCSTTATALVNGFSSFTTDAGNKTFVVGEATEFTFTTVANEDAGKMVIGTAEFSNPDAIDVLEYYEVQNNTWYPLEGDFGPAAGFPMSNATSTFRVTFKQAGTYTLTAYMKEVETGDTLCFAIATITVKNRSAISFTDESLVIKYSDVNATNDTLVDSVTGAEYTYKSDNENVVKVNEYGILTPTGIGEAAITVTRKENNGYMAASATYTVKVVAGVQGELTWEKTVPESIKWNAAEGYSNTVSGGSGTGDVTYTSDKPEIAEVDPNTGVLTLKKPGTVTITATKDGGTLYDDQTASYTLVVIKSEQAGLAFGESNPNAIYVGDEYTNAATGGSTGGTIMYKSSDETVATVDANGKVTALRVPTGNDSVSLEITATLVGDDYYEDATPVTYTLTIYRAPQKTPLVFEKGTAGQKIKYGEEYANAVSGGDTTPITYKSSDETIAKVDSEGNVTTYKAGKVTIRASVPESEIYKEQTLSYELVIELAGQTVTFEKGNTNIPAIAYGDSYQNKASATTKITYVSSDPSIADVDDEGNLIIKKSGTVTITATAAATEQYAEASSSYTITINKAKQTISFEKGNKVDVAFNDNENMFSNTASSNATKGDEEDKKGVKVLYDVASGEEYILKDENGELIFDTATGEFEIAGAGTIIISVSFSENERYAAAMSSYTVVIAKDDQIIAFENSENDEYEMINGDKSFTAPTASEQGTLFGTQDIIYTIDKDETGVVSAIDAKTGALTFTNKTGEVVIRATKPTDDNYNEATATYTLTVEDAELGENVFHTVIGEKINTTSEWYIGNVSIKAADGYQLSYSEAVDTADWKETLENAVTADGTHNISFHVQHVESGKIYEAQTVTIKRDATAPEASISDNKGNVWESGSFVDKLLTILTFGLWEPEQTEYSYVIDFDDATPPAGADVAKVEFFIHKDTTEVITDEAEIENIAQWQNYSKGQEIDVSVDMLFVLYAKVTDNAGNYVYVTTNGIVFDRTAVPQDNIVIDVVTEDSKGFYDEDVELNVQIDDAQPSSGINTVYYEVYNNGVLTQGYGKDEDNGILYQFTNENPKYEDLVASWNSATGNKNIIVDSELNNSDYVKVVITVIDNAENKTTKEISLKVCINKPTIDVTYGNVAFDGEEFGDDRTAVQSYEDVTYYDGNRVAKIVITGRTTVFNASDDPIIKVLETLGDTAQGSTYEVVDWNTTEGATPDDAIHTYLIKFNGSANYAFSIDYTDIFGNDLTHTSNKFAVDLEKPTATLTVDENNTWTKLLETLTFGLWKNDKVTVKATSDDATSPIKKFEMYRTDSTEIMTSVQLDALYAEGKFSKYEAFTVGEDAKFVVYIRVEDYAGRYDYICSDGYVVDMTDSTIGITFETETDLSHNNIPLYNGNVDVRIDVTEMADASYSGIKTVEYWVTCDDKETIRKTLYSYEYVRDEGINSNGGHLVIQELDENGELVTVLDKTGATPTYKELCYNITKTITIDAKANNSCNVEVFVKVTDNAGNPVEASKQLDIDVTEPAIKVEYDNNLPYKTVGERGYYPANREATITITERTGHFEEAKATAGIKIKAVDAKGEPIVVNDATLEVDSEGYLVDIAKLFGTIEWKSNEGNTPDETTHQAVLPYNCDANYTFDISYTDLAGKRNEGVDTTDEVTPYEFTVDKLEPTATITAGTKTWDKLLEVLTFGLYSQNAVKVSTVPKDETSPIESVKYYKTDDTKILSYEALEAVAKNEWIDITEDCEFTVSGDQRFVVYLKITDNAGKYRYINSDGCVIDSERSTITLTPENTELYHRHPDGKEIPLYNEDVDVLINVVEEKVKSYSGIKEVKYWVTCDGKISQPEKILYSFEYNMADYPANAPAYEELCHEFEETVTVVAENNNSCDVVLYVTVTDNAGNVKTESVAVDIDMTVPTITVDFDNDTAYKVVDGKGYFPAGRTATVVITERTAHFDAAKATGSIKITAVDATGATVIADCSALISAWTTEGTGNAAKHTATIDFTADANYEFTLSYEDLATNNCKYEEVKFADGTVAPRYFAVDKTVPTGTVTAGELGTWDKLIEILTFGLWSKDTVDVTGTTNDVTTPIESVSYYKTSDTTAKAEDELNAITSWTAFDGATGITVPADEKFVVYIRIIDYAGNVTYISTDGIVVDDTIPSFETVKPEITITPEPTNGIYNSDVTIGVSVIDPKTGDTEAYAGLKEIRYEVYNLGAKTQEGTLYSFEFVEENNEKVLRIYNKGELVSERKNYTPTYDDLLPAWEDRAAIVVDKDLNNSNDVKIVVYAVDNAGNDNRAECQIKIDITAPQIVIDYDNDAYDSERYFKADRIATINVIERNFDENDFMLVYMKDGQPVTVNGKDLKWEEPDVEQLTADNGDDKVHSTTYTFHDDADYLMGEDDTVATDATGVAIKPYVIFEDLANNSYVTRDDQGAIVHNGLTYEGEATTEFTIDQTDPIINVSYNNNSAENEKYFKESRIATIKVTEHNFPVDDAGHVDYTRAKFTITAERGGVAPTTDQISWTHDGDEHTAIIKFSTDGDYTFDVSVIDLAGNDKLPANYGTTVAGKDFVIDTTFEDMISQEGVENGVAYGHDAEVIPIIKISDINLQEYTVTLTGIQKDKTIDLTEEVNDLLEKGTETVTGIFDIFETKQDLDGIYTLTMTSKDKAGNEDSMEIIFTVNRYGSVYVYEQYLVDLIANGGSYVYSVDEDLIITEYNADKLVTDSLKIEITVDGRPLEDVEFTVTPEINDKVSVGSSGWYQYKYTISKNNFNTDGVYKIFVSSKDATGNTPENSNYEDMSMSFRVDSTQAEITSIVGLEEAIINAQNVTVKYTVFDTIGLKSIKVYVNGQLVDEITDFSADMNNFNGQFVINEQSSAQSVRIVVEDMSGNITDTSAEDFSSAYAFNSSVTVSTNIFVRWYANKGLFWGSIAGVVVLAGGVIFFIAAKRKKKEEEEAVSK